MDNIKPLKTEIDYDRAIAEVEKYFIDLPVYGTPEADRFDVLCSLIDAYDARHYPVADC